MANKKKTIRKHGPYLVAAVICERVLIEHDGVVSLMRIFDKVSVQRPENLPPGMVPTMPLTFFIGFKTGDAKGKKLLEIRVYHPSGKKGKSTIPVLFGEGAGVNARIQVPLSVEEQGTHWFDVVLDGKLVTRMPLDVSHTIAPDSQQSGAQKPKRGAESLRG